MTSDPKRKICLSEINVGISLVPAYCAACKAVLTRKAFRELVLGISWDSKRALQEDVIDSVYDGPEDCEQQIKAFAKKFAIVGAMQDGIKRNKEFYFKEAIEKLDEISFTPDMIHLAATGYGTRVVGESLKQMAKMKSKKKEAKQRIEKL